MLPENKIADDLSISRELKSVLYDIKDFYESIDFKLRCLDSNKNYLTSGAARTLALARTHLETSMLYAQKSIGLLGSDTTIIKKEDI